MTRYKGFYRKTMQERMTMAMADYHLAQALPSLPLTLANQMIENVVGIYGLPYGLVPNLKINHRLYLIPMVIEEPSVVAAASKGAQVVGNVTANMETKEIVGQVVFHEVRDPQGLVDRLVAMDDELMVVAKAASASMVARGGGPRRFWHRVFNHDDRTFVTLYLDFDPCDAMGANAVNTVLEAVAGSLRDQCCQDVLMSILSNYSDAALAHAQVRIPVGSLGASAEEGAKVAERIVNAAMYADVDPYRAVTHNKGIMNGIDAVITATGNDSRAVAAAVHAYAGRSGRYRSLSQWRIDQGALVGDIRLPLPVATVGGTLAIHPGAQWSLALLGNPDAKTLAIIMASVGLVQNFAALRALVSEGIQAGHMRMQARSLAIQVGAREEEIAPLVQALACHAVINAGLARDLLKQMRNTTADRSSAT